MSNNDIIRQLRYAFDFNDTQMADLFALGDLKVTRAQTSDWLKSDDNPEQVKLLDEELAHFLNGFINDKRGKKDGPAVAPEKELNNNIIFRKLKIALNLKDTDVIAIFKLVDLRIGKSELSALFRKPGHQHYRVCQDQFLRNFLHGIQKQYRIK